MSEESIIAEVGCPLCNHTHQYHMRIVRDEVFGAGPSGLRETGSREFTCLFTCPKKDAMFQATISIMEASDAPIDEVEVEGLIVEKVRKE